MTTFYSDPGPLLIPRLPAFAMLGVGPTLGHELINTGRLDARKLGGKTLITLESIKALAESLPSAVTPVSSTIAVAAEGEVR